MATQSLYRRYRPRRFSELKGQDHVVRALRTSVAEGREGQAYLFSGPRGTGKTTTARIMAKVLNCADPQDGEPCCECASCLSVEQGTSYDVHELDAASNNGVDAMRDLIDKASLGTPGRHKVYILDEVHMLSKGAEAALLKTLEEPPPHVVFVLATTDPQKMSDTIRSRTQHLQFHLLGADTLEEHVRWVASDAGLTVSDDAVDQVIAQGGGSPRDTLSALELVANSGGGGTAPIAVDEFVEAMIDSDPGRGLQMIARAVGQGRDPRTITEELIGHLRNGFLALMAPDLVQLPSQRVAALTDLAQRAGPGGLVKGVEQLGEALVEMRSAPDPRVLLDVATVRLCSAEVATDVDALATRVHRLERRLDERDSSESPSAPPAPPAPAPSAQASHAARSKLGARAGARAASSSGEPTTGTAVHAGAGAAPHDPPPTADDPGTEPPESRRGPADEPVVDTPGGAGEPITESDWEAVRPRLKGMARAVFAPATLVAVDGGNVTLGLPNDAHRAKCEQHRSVVEEALTTHSGGRVTVELVVDGDGPGPSGGPGRGEGPHDLTAVGRTESAAHTGSPSAAHATSGSLAEDVDARARSDSSAARPAVDPDASTSAQLRVVPGSADDPPAEAVRNGRAIADRARQEGLPADDPPEPKIDSLPDDDEVDLDDLTDAPPESVKSPVDRLAEAFPGSELVDDPY